MVVAQRHVAPFVGRQLPESEQRASVLGRAAVAGEHAFELAVDYHHPMALGALGAKRRPRSAHQGLMRDSEHRQVVRRIDEPARLVGGDVHPQLLEQPEDRAGLAGPGRVVVAGDEHDRRVRQCLAETLELTEGEDDSRVGGPDRVEQVAGHDDRVRPGCDDTVDGEPKGLGDVGFPLVDAGRGLPVVLSDAEVGIGDMGEFHTINVS